MGLSSPVAAAIANLVFLVNLSYRFRLPSLGPLVSLSTLNLTSPSSYFFIFVGCILRLNCYGVAADYLSFTYEEGDMFALSGVRPGFGNPLESVKDPFYFWSVIEPDFADADWCYFICKDMLFLFIEFFPVLLPASLSWDFILSSLFGEELALTIPKL